MAATEQSEHKAQPKVIVSVESLTFPGKFELQEMPPPPAADISPGLLASALPLIKKMNEKLVEMVDMKDDPFFSKFVQAPSFLRSLLHDKYERTAKFHKMTRGPSKVSGEVIALAIDPATNEMITEEQYMKELADIQKEFDKADDELCELVTKVEKQIQEMCGAYPGVSGRLVYQTINYRAAQEYFAAEAAQQTEHKPGAAQ